MPDRECPNDPADCPSTEQLAEFDSGNVSGGELEKLEACVRDCSECARRIEELPAADPLIHELRSPFESPGEEKDGFDQSECDSITEQVTSIVHEAAVASVATA